jgi:hypothetical protein
MAQSATRSCRRPQCLHPHSLELFRRDFPLVRQFQPRQWLVGQAVPEAGDRLVEGAIPLAVDDVDLPGRPAAGELDVLQIVRIRLVRAFEVAFAGRNRPPPGMRPTKMAVVPLGVPGTVAPR